MKVACNHFICYREMLRKSIESLANIFVDDKEVQRESNCDENDVYNLYSSITSYLAKNPLDQVIEYLGGRDKVAEVNTKARDSLGI